MKTKLKITYEESSYIDWLFVYSKSR